MNSLGLRRTIGALVVAVGVTAAVAGCASTGGTGDTGTGSGLTAADAYRLGCPAVDAVTAGGSIANQAAVAGLEGLKQNVRLDADSTRFVDAALGLLRSDRPSEASADTKKLIIDQCREHGYRLQNLR
ncbi:hypothetical protein FHX74_002463 [Friedmanniella endophytica]|uniref:Lipoprotein n=1 Tax=Microlunatus kandeliicorticis TaxID=1759536 RepID=A0A7W3IT90_9ACTN|nr:hypothetical protein [Microlunatus kandeliicorticis]MBA8794844.1 hypothetical protein [Microlunatus kandeliicorticis]